MTPLPARSSVRALLAASVAMGFLACAPSVPRVVNPDYKGMKLDGRVLRVAPILDLEIVNNDDLVDDWGDQRPPREMLTALFGRNLSALVDHAKVEIDSLSTGREGPLRMAELDLPEGEGSLRVTFWFPSDSLAARTDAAPDTGSDSASAAPQDPAGAPNPPSRDLVFQINRLKVERLSNGSGAAPFMVPNPSGVGMMMVGGGNPGSRLQLEATYIVWDYRAGKPVAYGRAIGTAGFMMAMTRDDWRIAARDAALDMLKGTPFTGRKYREALEPPRRY